MAVRDVKEYYYKLLVQSAEMKADLDDFKKALEAGYITEDKLTEVREQANIIEANFERVGYILYLLELPNRASKQDKWKKQNSNLTNHFAKVKADEQAIFDENKSALDQLRIELKKLEKNDKKE